MQLAQLNVAKPRYPLDSHAMSEFMQNLDPVNALAEASNGFIWRLKDEGGNATDIRPDNAVDLLVNMSVWTDAQALKDFMLSSQHLGFMKRKNEWFFPSNQPSYVLWWVADGHQPSLDEAMTRLTLLQQQGDSVDAFSFKRLFDAPI